MFALPVELHLVSFFVTVASFSSVLISALLPSNYLPFVFLYMVGALECLLLNNSYGENVQNNDISSGKAMLSSFLLQFGKITSLPSLYLIMHPITWIHVVLHALHQFFSEVTPSEDMLEQGISLRRPLVE